MEEKERIEKDIELFEKNIKKVKNERIKDMATRYYEDAKYYMEKGDYFTSFGSINYAHGLIDAILNRKTRIIEVNGTIASGKTCIVEAVLDKLKYDYEIAVVVAKYVGNEDSKRIEKHGIKAININTGNKCVDEELFERALEEIDEELDLIFLENIDVTCPYILEDSKKMIILDATLGKNIVYKFPMPIQMADLIVLNKIDASNDEKMMEEIKNVANGEIILASCKDGIGLEKILEWIKKLL